ncbi:MAG: MliC family protein [Gammaproteobacteria bacterium]|nr:MliC family protein [Gammaproteobacteria bacterium]
MQWRETYQGTFGQICYVVAVLTCSVGLLVGCAAPATGFPSKTVEKNSKPLAAPPAQASLPIGTMEANETSSWVASSSCNGPLVDAVALVVCQNSALTLLDRQLQGVFQAALKNAGELTQLQQDYSLQNIQRHQRQWLSHREQCLGRPDVVSCLSAMYVMRISELQVNFLLTPVHKTEQFQCRQQQVLEVEYFYSKHNAVKVHWQNKQSLLFLEPSGNGSLYKNAQQTLWLIQRVVTFKDEAQNITLHCLQRRSS